ncbi:MAG: flagellar export protein FliJ [Clostridia bacterium]|nr:flagellar export protein FliJ [Clostridia bacterium]
MAKFVFKFQPLLDLKTQMEDSLKNELGKAIQKLEQEKEVLRTMETEREECIRQFNEKSSQGIVVERLKEYNLYISHLKERMEKQKENIKAAQKNVDKVREQLIKVVQERKMLDKLKEKKLEEYKKEQLVQEQKVIDEVVSFKYTNRINNEM